MISVLVTLLVFVGSIALCTFAVLTLFRYLMKWLGMREVQKDGVLLADQGIEYVGFIWLIKHSASYTDIETVEFVSYPKAWFLYFRYGPTGQWMCKQVGTDVVVIRLKGLRMTKTLFVTPENASEFVDKLKVKMSITGSENGPEKGRSHGEG